MVGQRLSYFDASNSFKILSLFALMYGFLMEASFSCNLRAHLVEKQTEEVADSLEDMLRLDRIYLYPVS